MIFQLFNTPFSFTRRPIRSHSPSKVCLLEHISNGTTLLFFLLRDTDLNYCPFGNEAKSGEKDIKSAFQAALGGTRSGLTMLKCLSRFKFLRNRKSEVGYRASGLV
jgi:hypothetical protein